MFTTLETGQIVYSKCGRDKGRSFIVTECCGEYAYLVDGSLRPLNKPKKKKVKHIQKTNDIDVEIKMKLENNQYLNDADIRKALLSKGHEPLSRPGSEALF